MPCHSHFGRVQTQQKNAWEMRSHSLIKKLHYEYHMFVRISNSMKAFLGEIIYLWQFSASFYLFVWQVNKSDIKCQISQGFQTRNIFFFSIFFYFDWLGGTTNKTSKQRKNGNFMIIKQCYYAWTWKKLINAESKYQYGITTIDWYAFDAIIVCWFFLGGLMQQNSNKTPN